MGHLHYSCCARFCGGWHWRPAASRQSVLGLTLWTFLTTVVPFYFLSTIVSVPDEPLCPGWIPLSSVQPLDVVLRNAKEIWLFSFLFTRTTHPSVRLVCFQCANRASTSPRWEIRSVQNVRLTASLTTRGRCSVAVKRTTSALRETPWPWPVPVSLHFFLPIRPFSKIFSHSSGCNGAEAGLIYWTAPFLVASVSSFLSHSCRFLQQTFYNSNKNG